MTIDMKINCIINVNTVMQELDNIKNQLQTNGSTLVINLANIEIIDVSGLAMLLEAKIIAKQQNKQLKFTGHTSNILKMCLLYHVEL
jgi:ABC-type transporter Mla MlaB component